VVVVVGRRTYPAEVGGSDAGEVEPAGGRGGASEEDGREEEGEEDSRVRRHGVLPASDSEQALEAREKREGGVSERSRLAGSGRG
jgi:hypothetical protein